MNSPAAATSNPLGLQVEILERSFDVLAPRGPEMVERFYEELFRRYPEVKPLFAGTDMEAQRKHLLGALVLVVENVRFPEKLVPALTALGSKHENYGAVAEHYGAVAATLLDVMREFAGELWTEEVHQAWQQALNLIAETMLGAYGASRQTPQEGETMTTTTAAPEAVNGQEDEAVRLRGAIEGSATPMMMVDRDLVITYANQATVELVTKNLETFRTAFPGFAVDNLIGTCIDTFHKDPSHQRRILDDPRNLPYQADIQVGELSFALNITAIKDADGTYVGNNLEWNDVTEARAQADSAARTQGAIEGSATAMMMVDRDLLITYANQATVELVTKNLETFRTAFPGFDVEKLIGQCIDQFHKDPSHQRRILDDPKNLPYQADIEVGEMRFALNITAIMDLDGNYVGNNLEWNDVTEVRAQATRAESLFSMIEGASAFFMMCDQDLRITYVNPSIVKMLGKYQGALRELFPSFDVNNLIGVCIDDFHKNPAHQRRLLADDANMPYVTEINVGGLEFGLTLTALKDGEGNFMGNAVEWTDNNARATYRDEVGKLLENAKVGNLAYRADMEKLDEVYQPMMEAIHDIVDAIVEPLKVAAAYIERIGKGEIPDEITQEYHGDFNDIKESLNSCIQSLRGLIVEDGGKALEAAAARNLTQRVERDYEGLYGTMKENINSLLSSLDEALTQVAQGTDQVASASGQISAGSQTLAQGASEQASSLEEIGSSVEELTSMSKQNAANAQEARGLTDSARGSAEKGVESMGRLSEAIDKIKASSDETAKIIKTIDEIAFQTNLLALNAAVEAARAGEAGKGFAVVAEEVRNLAMRSAEAARNTSDLIEGSVKNAEAGVTMNQEVLKNFEEINEQIGKVAEVIKEISTASEQQSDGLGQINSGVDQLNQLTQQNAANSEESASAAEELSSQAEEMRSVVASFQLSQSVGSQQHLAAQAPGPQQQQYLPAQVPGPQQQQYLPAQAPGPQQQQYLPAQAPRPQQQYLPAQAPGPQQQQYLPAQAPGPQQAPVQQAPAQGGQGNGAPQRPEEVIPLEEEDETVLKRF